MPQISTPLLERDALASLNQLRNGPGALRLVSHLMTVVLGGVVWAQQGWPLALRLAGLLICGVGLATSFAPLHECCHRTAFRGRKLNDAVAWMAGLLSSYNSTYYRRYHQWHHRYTHQPGLDPELEDPVPTSPWAYPLYISGLFKAPLIRQKGGGASTYSMCVCMCAKYIIIIRRGPHTQGPHCQKEPSSNEKIVSIEDY